MTVAKRLKLRLFLEGQEVPVISASVSGGMGQPAAAVLQVVPTDDIFNLLPRTLVHLFFFDLHPSSEASQALNKSDTSGYQGLSNEEKTILGDNYRLLFAGEFMNFSFERSPSGRAVMLQCTDFSSYWDVAKQYFVTGGTDSGGPTLAGRNAAFAGSSASGFSAPDESASPVQALINVLTSKPSTVPDLDGLLGGIIHLLECIGGVFKGFGRYRGLNDFFSAAELRLHLAQMIGVSPKDTSSLALIKHKEFKGWIRQTLSKNRNLVSFRQILDVLMARIYHTYVSIPAPPLRPSYPTTITVQVPAGTAIPAGMHPVRKERIQKLRSFIKASEGGEATQEATEAKFKAAKDEVIKGAPTTDALVVDKLAKPDTAKGQMQYAVGEDLKFLSAARTGEGAERLRALAKEALKRYMGGSGRMVDTQKQVTVLERLVTHIFRPNIYFCAPPRCNVLFPDNYTSMSYQRSFMGEITRLQLESQKEWVADTVSSSEPGSHKKRYWAPDSKDINDVLARVSAKQGSRFVMAHEKFTGILPAFDTIADISAFQKTVNAQGDRPPIDYMQNVANFNFFAHRFGARSMNVNGPFNPYLVPGMPGLVIDQYRADSVRIEMGIHPTQYLGLINELRHQVSQEGGTTSVNLGLCRTHNERAEFLGGLVQTVSEAVGKKKATFKKTLRSQDAKDLFEAVGSTPTGGVAQQVKADIAGKNIPGVGVIKSIGKSSVVGDTTTTEVEVSGFVSIYKSKQVEVPLDDALFPPWMSPIYKNMSIGRDFYQDLLGIGSICDPVQVGSADREVPGSPPYLPDSISAKAMQGLKPEALSKLKASMKSVTGAGTTGFLDSQSTDTVSQAVSDGIAGEVGLGATVEQSVDALVDTYKALKESDFDFDAFYEAYSWRPIATMRQILGDPDFDLSAGMSKKLQPIQDQVSSLLKTKAKVDKLTGGKISALSGIDGASLPSGSKILSDLAGANKQIESTLKSSLPLPGEGFHSRAFGPYDQMEFLHHRAAARYDGSGDIREVDPDIDPRGERYRRVQAYLAVLKADKGLLG